MRIRIEKNEQPKRKPAADDPLKFGTIFTDHMFLMDYDEAQGWHDPRVVPYGGITMDPAAKVLHYGQEMYEGMKAYRAEDGRILLFRPKMNVERANRSSKRICMPQIPEALFLGGIEALVRQDSDWVPGREGTSLYIRPFMIATDPYLGVSPSSKYLFAIILSPVGAYYPEGLDPVKIWIEDEFVRAVQGGTGEAKTGGNYAASLIAQMKAKEAGYSQVLWLDGVERRYVEEVGAMNIFFKIDGRIVTPALSGSILPGVTRDSVLTLCRSWGMPVEERRISVEELEAAYDNGTLEEAFGTGTAAVISPVGVLRWKERIMKVGDGGIGGTSQRLYDTLSGIQRGAVEDAFGWTHSVI